MKSATPYSRRSKQGGFGTMLVIVSLSASFLLAAGFVVYLQLQNTQSVGFAQAEKRSLYCAEAGLAEATTTLIANSGTWGVLLDADPSNNPTWYPIQRDIDNPADGVVDYRVTVEDNGDESTSDGPDNPYADRDGRIMMVSRCVKWPEYPREVRQLVMVSGGGYIYKSQAGHGSGNTGNLN